jgi:glycerol-3-phosphate acyltransferase PlsX
MRPGRGWPRVGVLSNERKTTRNEPPRRERAVVGTSLNYIGYVEGRDIFNGKVDVVVCDGFTGNVALKTMEGLAGFAGEVLKSAFNRNLSSRLGYLISRNSLKEAYRRLDYAEYGGAPLIGLDGVAIVAHGGSNPLAIKNAIRAARDAVDQKVNQHIAEALADSDLGGEKKGGFPRKIFERIKSKIESMGHKDDPPRDPDDREG